MPLISCLCVTKNTPDFFNKAIECFHNQTYDNKELILVTDEKNPYIEDLRLHVCDNVKLFTAPHGSTIGKLRALSVEKASGEYVATWDDDDIHHKDRLFAQHFYINRIVGAEACYLKRVLIHDMVTGDKGISKNTRGSCQTMVALKETLPKYDGRRKIREDMPIRKYHVDSNKAVIVNEPQLYVYRFHDSNTVAIVENRKNLQNLIDVRI